MTPGSPTEAALVADDAGAARGALTSWRLLVAIMCVVMALLALGVWALQNQIRTRTLDSTAKGVMILTSVVVDRSITLNDIADGIHPTNRSKLDGDLILLKERGHVLALAIWALSDGGLVYADVDNTATGALTPDLVTRARAGTPFAGPGADRSGGALEIYYPYDANGDGVMDAVAQVVLPRQEMDKSIANSTRLLYGGGVLVLLIVVAGIRQVRRRQMAQNHATVHDVLTGLGNPTLLRRLAMRMLNASSTHTPTGLVLIDLDGFKGGQQHARPQRGGRVADRGGPPARSVRRRRRRPGPKRWHRPARRVPAERRPVQMRHPVGRSPARTRPGQFQ